MNNKIISRIKGHVMRSAIEGSVNTPTSFVDQLIKGDRNKRVSYAALRSTQNLQGAISQSTLDKNHEYNRNHVLKSHRSARSPGSMIIQDTNLMIRDKKQNNICMLDIIFMIYDIASSLFIDF